MSDKSMTERAKEPEFTQRDLTCHGCGMLLDHPAEYHTFVHCELMKQCRNGSTVKDNIEYTVENHPKFKELTAERDELTRKNAVLMATLQACRDKWDTAGNGRCGVCRSGYRMSDLKGNVQRCENPACLSHQIRSAIKECK